MSIKILQQVRFFLSFLSGAKQLPSKAEMLQITAAENAKAFELRGTKRHMHMLESLQVSKLLSIVHNFY